MKRTTIMADERLIERLREIARRENTSLASVIREGLELRASRPSKRPRFIGAGRSRSAQRTNIAEEASEMKFEPLSWR